jgi:peptidoglycan/xylan/chitin deacetylase (PgdA/CDA1 family)
MYSQSSVWDSDLEHRFLLNDSPAVDVFRDAFVQDVEESRLSASFRAYYRLRSLIPLPVRQLLQRFRPVQQSSEWYFAHEFETSLSIACPKAGDLLIPTLHPWPDGADFAFVPTHDVETAEGMRRIERIANLEEDLGFRSSWNIVPHKYPVDRGLLRDLQKRGFEIGIHGYNHDGKLFTSRAVFESRVPGMNGALKEFGAVGFRAPMVHRNLQWMQALEIEYDASCFDIDPYQAMPGGVGGVWPFIVGRFVELPYTMPQDHTLFIALAERDGTIWERKFEHVARLGGMALFIAHPDYLDPGPRMNTYRSLLEKARETSGMWHALPREVASWWRARDASTLQMHSGGEWHVIGPAANRGRAAAFYASSCSSQSAGTKTTNFAPQLTAAFHWRKLPTTEPTSAAYAPATSI